MDQRLINEIEHSKYLIEKGAGEIWNWETPAGKKRWKRRVKMLTNGLIEDDIVLEVGCGTGYFTKEIQKTGSKIIAIDISPDFINICTNSFLYTNVQFKVDNAYDLNFPDNNFDHIVGSSVLHHLNIEKAIKEFFRVLKPGGTVLFTEPNMMNPQIALQKNIPFIKKSLGDSPDETAFFRWSLKKKFKKMDLLILIFIRLIFCILKPR